MSPIGSTDESINLGTIDPSAVEVNPAVWVRSEHTLINALLAWPIKMNDQHLPQGCETGELSEESSLSLSHF